MDEASTGVTLKLLDCCLLTGIQETVTKSTHSPQIVSQAYYMCSTPPYNADNCNHVDAETINVPHARWWDKIY